MPLEANRDVRGVGLGSTFAPESLDLFEWDAKHAPRTIAMQLAAAAEAVDRCPVRAESHRCLVHGKGSRRLGWGAILLHHGGQGQGGGGGLVAAGVLKVFGVRY
jgi:hypothetical protein